jgi:CheY-like chemotaxis protein
METEPASEFCPKCQLVQPTLGFMEDSRTVRRCLMCGFPVESGLTLENGGGAELPRPPEVKILCVDDDPLNLQLNGDILKFHGYKVLNALDGPTALEIAARERPALILLDIMMPGMDGFEVCHRLKADPALKDIPIIVLTAMTDTRLNARAFEAGAQLAMRKPAEPAVVLRTIEAALALSLPRQSEGPGDVLSQVSAVVPGPDPVEAEPERKVDLAIPVHPVPLTLWTSDGTATSGQVFLRLNVLGHAGSETVQDRLNDEDQFLALSLAGDPSLAFVNKLQIVRVELPAEEDVPEVPASLMGVSVEPVLVQLLGGQELRGTVCTEGPAGKRRISDFLNRQSAFLTVRAADRLHLVHKRFVVRIVPLHA